MCIGGAEETRGWVSQSEAGTIGPPLKNNCPLIKWFIVKNSLWL